MPPCFSPDGGSIAFSTGRSLKKVPLAGGAALTVADDLDAADVCDWAEDGNIYFGATPGIMRVAAAGGRAELVAGFDAASGESTYEIPHLLPGGKQLMYTVVRGGVTGLNVVVLDLATREKKSVLEGAGFAAYAPSGPGTARGHLVYGRSGALFAAPFDLRTLTAGPSSPVLEGVASFGPISVVSVSDTGTLAYAAGDSLAFGAKLRWVDRTGAAQELPEAAHTYGDLILSPDGRRAAVSFLDLETFTADLWLYELDGDRLTRLTFGGVNGAPVWTPEGRRLIYWHADTVTFNEGELRAVAADSSAAPVTLAALKGGALQPTSISADGKVLIGTRSRGAVNDIVSLPLDDAPAAGGPAGAAPALVLATSFDERDAQLSPDARFLAYTSNESGRDEVYVIPYPGPGGKTQVSTDGGKLPRWNRNGRELFYANGTQLLAVEVETVETSPVFRRLTPKVLFDAPLLADPNSDIYDVAPDGSRFLMVAPAESGKPLQLRVVVNWFEELRRLAPAQ